MVEARPVGQAAAHRVGLVVEARKKGPDAGDQARRRKRPARFIAEQVRADLAPRID